MVILASTHRSLAVLYTPVGWRCIPFLPRGAPLHLLFDLMPWIKCSVQPVKAVRGVRKLAGVVKPAPIRFDQHALRWTEVVFGDADEVTSRVHPNCCLHDILGVQP